MKNSTSSTTITSLVTRWGQKASFWQLMLVCAVGVATSVQATTISNTVTPKSNDKVLICHNGHDIYVSMNAAQAHLSQHAGDQLGGCGGDPGPVPARSAAASATAVSK